MGHSASYKGCPFIKYALAKKKEFKSSKYNKKLQNINRISHAVRENVSYAQAVGLTTPQTQPYNALTSLPPRPRRETFPPSAKSLPQQDDNANSSTPPSWISNLKEEIAVMVTRQFQALASQIAANTAQIEFILNSLFAKDNV